MNFYGEAIETKRDYLKSVIKHRIGVHRLLKERELTIAKDSNIDLRHMYDAEIEGLQQAESYFWGSRITQMVLASGQQIPHEVTFDPLWLNSASGWWWFGRSSPLLGLSRESEHRYIHALLYYFTSGILHVSTYELFEGKLERLGAFTWQEGESLELALTRLSESEGRAEAWHTPELKLDKTISLLMDNVALARQQIDHVNLKIAATKEEVATLEGLSEEEQENYKLPEPVHQRVESIPVPVKAYTEKELEFNRNAESRFSAWKEASANALTTFACGNLWLQQKIVVTELALLQRAARRRLERAQVTTRCLVVQLRRKEYIKTSGDEHEPVDWAWQWAVRGHWRHQPTKEGIKLVFIHPYLKGPEDRPLKPGTERVFAVTR